MFFLSPDWVLVFDLPGRHKDRIDFGPFLGCWSLEQVRIIVFSIVFSFECHQAFEALDGQVQVIRDLGSSACDIGLIRTSKGVLQRSQVILQRVPRIGGTEC